MTKRQHKTKRKKPLVLPHSHTGKHVAHHHASHLPLLFIVLFAGFLLLGVRQMAQAATYNVVAKVPAPLPPGPAAITSPIDGAEFTEIPIPVAGTCPAGYLVKITRNGVFSGSAVCDAGGLFSIDSDLFAGSNDLSASAYNSTDDEGPASPDVTVTYTPPAPVAPEPAPAPENEAEPEEAVGTAPTVPVTAANQLVIKADDELKTVIIGRELEWEVELTGGKGPYAFTVDWGDGTSEVFIRENDGKFTIRHTYHKISETEDTFLVTLRSSDADGQKAFIELSVQVLTPFYDTISGTTASSIWTDPNLQKALWIAYFGTATIAISVFVGEKLALHAAAEAIKASKVRLRHR